MHVEKWIESDNNRNSGAGLGPHDFEQALFRNQTGCFNGVDLQGNYLYRNNNLNLLFSYNKLWRAAESVHKRTAAMTPQGNHIESIALTIEAFESVYHPPLQDDWATKLNISLVFSGRPLFPNELDLAVVGPLGGIGGYVVNNSTRIYFTALNGSRRDTLEYMIDWNTAVVGEQIAYVREFGTNNIRELLTDGDNGSIFLDVP